MMKTIIPFGLCYFGLLFNGYAQQSSAKLVEVKDKALVKLLGSLDTVITKNNGNLNISIYSFSNESGSAHAPGTDEVTNKLMVLTSEFGEYPEQHLFKCGDFYGPKIRDIQSLPNGDFSFNLVYGAYDHKKRLAYHVSLRKMTVKQVPVTK
jgi:hypothetical protein